MLHIHAVTIPSWPQWSAVVALHALPQPPQWAKDKSSAPPAPSRLTHRISQHMKPAPHAGEQRGSAPASDRRASGGPVSLGPSGTQDPLTHTSPAPHARPHPPQFMGLVKMSTHWLPIEVAQHAWTDAHVVPQTTAASKRGTSAPPSAPGAPGSHAEIASVTATSAASSLHIARGYRAPCRNRCVPSRQPPAPNKIKPLALTRLRQPP